MNEYKKVTVRVPKDDPIWDGIQNGANVETSLKFTEDYLEKRLVDMKKSYNPLTKSRIERRREDYNKAIDDVLEIIKSD